MMILPGIKIKPKKSLIIIAGEKPDPVWQAEKTRRKRGVKAQKKFAEADADFEAFMTSPLVTRAPGVQIRANRFYAGYLAWKEAQEAPQDQLFSKTPPMALRAFGIRMRQHFEVHEGQGKVVTYLGVTLTRVLLEGKG